MSDDNVCVNAMCAKHYNGPSDWNCTAAAPDDGTYIGDGNDRQYVQPEPESNPVDTVFAMSASEFAGMTAKERDVALFLLLCDMAGKVRELKYKVEDYEAKGRALMSPEGMSELTSKFLGSGPLGGLMGLLG